MIDNKELLGVIGFLLTLNGFAFRYIFNSHNNKIDELQKNCAKVAEKVQGNVDALELKVDNKIEVLDKDIKRVGEKLGEQLSKLTSELFQKIDQNRIENNAALININARLDRLLTGKQNP